MRAWFLLVLFAKLLLPTAIVAQSINQMDSTGKKNGLWKIYGKDKKDPVFCSDCIIEEGHYDSGKKTGEWKSYFPKGSLKSVVEYKNNRPQGKYRIFYESGQLEEEGIFIRVHYLDTFKRYYPNGKMKELKYYNSNGKTEGEIYYWFENGKLELKYRVANGVEDGKLERFYPNGDLKERRFYVNGWAVTDSVEWHNLKTRQNNDSTGFNKPPPANELKYNTLYNDKGKIILDGQFYQHKLYNGKKYIYNHKDEILRIESYRDGLYIGDVPIEIKTEEKPHNNSDKNIKDGYPGKIIENSKRLEQDGEFKDGKLWNGKWYKYDKNGLLIKIEIYKEGKYVSDGKLE